MGFWYSLWRWAKRRHPDKSARLDTPSVLALVWATQGCLRPTRAKHAGGKPLWLRLVDPTDIGIRRHVKIRSEANPLRPAVAGLLRRLRSSRISGFIVPTLIETVMCTGSAHAGLSHGLSRMTGNFHVRFLGEGAAAMPLPYPTGKFRVQTDQRHRCVYHGRQLGRPVLRPPACLARRIASVIKSGFIWSSVHHFTSATLGVSPRCLLHATVFSKQPLRLALTVPCIAKRRGQCHGHFFTFSRSRPSSWL